MRLNYIAFGLFLGAGMAKNVFKGLTINDVKSFEKELVLNKRDAKNVVSLEFSEASLGSLKKHKRDGKNVYDLKFSLDDDSLLDKRDGKNVVHLDTFLGKRDAKNVQHYSVVVDEDVLASKLVKRDGQNVFELQVPLSEFDNEFEYTLMPEVKKENLATALTQIQDISIFSSYIRDMVDLYKKCDNDDDYNINSQDGNMLLIFAPTDEAVVQLTQKPWEFPRSVSQDEDADANIRDFVESHIVQGSNIADFSKEEVVLSSLNGNKIHLRNGHKGFELSLDDVDEWLAIQRIEIMANGALLVIDKTLSWPQRS
ncbi:hypothetical protein OGAPHI_001498 [Ogataea philodendri]|uniref:FAS1 domain-containing protein n=1 Tax=Ogataea philodendri TaxID=1378263 RepID=A0A9P8PCB7_9ASCO|nr:uncharacterized protein OGAPHI_001498 [Ogataea philodendri]KAH3669377.1 hypothetical protein OGAPHI_001498 [Ogataea philodendri]